MTAFLAVLTGAVVLSQVQLPVRTPSNTTEPVPLTSEHHHHLVFSSPQIRAFYVVIPPGDQTLIHQHDVNYVWVGLGDADVVNATVNKLPDRLHSKDGALHFSPGHFAHKAINVGNTTYRNVTIELLQDQKNPHNLCEEVLKEQPLHCVPAKGGRILQSPGVTVQPDFATDEIEFDTVSLAAGAEVKLAGEAIPPVVIALDRTTANAYPVSDNSTHADPKNLKAGDVISGKKDIPLTLHNAGSDSARFLVFEFLNSR